MLWCFRYFAFIAFEMFLGVVLPGVVVKGLPLANGDRLVYNCNALAAWYPGLLWSVAACFGQVCYAHHISCSSPHQHLVYHPSDGLLLFVGPAHYVSC